jgi:hypothetical protein
MKNLFDATYTELIPGKPALTKAPLMVLVREDSEWTQGYVDCMAFNCKSEEVWIDENGEEVTEPMDTTQCDCCGGWYCADHLKGGERYCQDCKRFSPAMIQAVIAFREKLNKDEL